MGSWSKVHAPAMTAALHRSLRVLELLVAHPEGRSLSSLAQLTEMPLSATHRVLTDLCQAGYVRQVSEQGIYVLTIKLVAMGLTFLSGSGVVDIAQPLLERLAKHSGELVRMAVRDADDLVFVAKAQGATRGLRYDPDMGLSVALSCSAAGHALLSTMTDHEALAVVARQGLGRPADHGPRAPTTMRALLPYIRAARKRGFSLIVEVFAPGMSAMSAPIRRRDGQVIGVVTIAGPMVRLTEPRMVELGPELIATAAEIGGASQASAFFKQRAA
jgi:IclR family transcriptional regulator, acetate operon repressor